MFALIACRRHLPWIAAGVLLLAALVGSYRLSTYLRTGHRLVGDGLQAQIPRSFELERCQTMIDDLDQRIASHGERLVALEIDRESIAEEQQRLTRSVADEEAALRELRAALQTPTAETRFRGQRLSGEALRREAATRADRLEYQRSMLAGKTASLAAIDQTLGDAHRHLDEAAHQRDRYRLRLEQLQAQAEHVAIRQELQLSAGDLPGIDDDLLSEVDQTFKRLERDLAIQDRRLDVRQPTRDIATTDHQALDDRLAALLDPQTRD